jgi:hypothetical protein
MPERAAINSTHNPREEDYNYQPIQYAEVYEHHVLQSRMDEICIAL